VRAVTANSLVSWRMVNERFMCFARALGFLASSPDLPDNFSVPDYPLTLTSTSSKKIRAKSRPY